MSGIQKSTLQTWASFKFEKKIGLVLSMDETVCFMQNDNTKGKTNYG